MTTSKPSKPKSKVQQIASSISSTTKVSAHPRQGTKGVTEHQRKKTQGQKDAELADRLLKDSNPFGEAPKNLWQKGKSLSTNQKSNPFGEVPKDLFQDPNDPKFKEAPHKHDYVKTQKGGKGYIRSLQRDKGTATVEYDNGGKETHNITDLSLEIMRWGDRSTKNDGGGWKKYTHTTWD